LVYKSLGAFQRYKIFRYYSIGPDKNILSRAKAKLVQIKLCHEKFGYAGAYQELLCRNVIKITVSHVAEPILYNLPI
jgi:hypothetical protein